MSESIEAKLQKVHASSLESFTKATDVQYAERMNCLQDRRFMLTGGVWEGWLSDQFANKPQIEVNKLTLAIRRIFSEYRNNRITVDFVSKDGEENEMAEVCDGLYRADEQDSTALEAYDNAFEEGVKGGFGAWVLEDEYEDGFDYDEEEEEDEKRKQRIRILPIFDADGCVFFDANAKRYDKSDAVEAWDLRKYTYEAYKEAFNDDPTTWPKNITGAMFDWCGDFGVYVANYYKVENKKEKVQIWKDLLGKETNYKQSRFDEDEDLEQELKTIGMSLKSIRTVRVKKVHKYLMSGGKVLKDCGYIAGECIPIVPFYGYREMVDGIERIKGHVRDCKDAIRLKAMQQSQLALISSMSPVEKPILFPQQVVGLTDLWAKDAIDNHPFLLINSLKNADNTDNFAPPMAYTRSPAIPPALAAIIQLAEQDIQDMIGNQTQMDKVASNTSGKAIELVQNRVDMQSFIFISNFAKSMVRCGQIWLSKARELYIEDSRNMKSVKEDGESGRVILNKPYQGEGGGYANDMEVVNFDVVANVGPSSVTKKQGVQRMIMDLMAVTDDPAEKAMLSSVMILNSEGEGMSGLKKYHRKKLVSIGVEEPTAEEKAQMDAAEQEQDPMQALALEEAMKKIAELESKIRLNAANTAKAEADTSKIVEETTAQQIENALILTQGAEVKAVNPGPSN